MDARLCPFIFPQFHFGMGESSRRRVDRFLGCSSLALCGLFQSVLFGQEADVSHEPLERLLAVPNGHRCTAVAVVFVFSALREAFLDASIKLWGNNCTENLKKTIKS